MIPGVDIQGLKTEAQRLFDKMRDAYADRDIQRRHADELFPPTFPYAGARLAPLQEVSS
jgi:8-oxoguanine deaminase